MTLKGMWKVPYIFLALTFWNKQTQKFVLEFAFETELIEIFFIYIYIFEDTLDILKSILIE